MKTLRLFSISFIFAAFFAVSAFAQAQPATKVALVNTDAFYAEKIGITKIETAYTKLNAEFKTEFTGIENGVNKLQALQKEIAAAQDLASKGGKVDENAIRAKAEEFQNLQVEIKRKQEDAKLRFGKREAAIMSPIVQDIGKFIQTYAKQKGFTLVMDAGKLAEARILLFSEDATDITKEFITYYNSQPGGTATK